MALVVTPSWNDTGMDLSGLTVQKISKRHEWALGEREVSVHLQSWMFGVTMVKK